MVGDEASVLTPSKKKIKNIAIFLKDEESESEEEEKENALPDPETFGRGKRTAVIADKLRQDTTAEEKRKGNLNFRAVVEFSIFVQLRFLNDPVFCLKVQNIQIFH